MFNRTVFWWELRRVVGGPSPRLFLLGFGVSLGMSALGLLNGNRAAHSFFEVFSLMQLAGILLLTPGAFADMIAGEREAGRLDPLLASDLSSSEILTSKFLARLLLPLLFVLAGMLAFALGLGTSPGMLAAWLAVGLVHLSTMLCVACVTSWISVGQKHSATAWLMAWLGTLALVCLPPLLIPTPAWSNDWRWNLPAAADHIVRYGLVSWNPLAAIPTLTSGFRWLNDAPTLGLLLGSQAIVSLVCWTLAVRELRRPIEDPEPSPTVAAWPRLIAERTDAVYWKEFRAAQTILKQNRLARYFLILAPIVWLVMAAGVVGGEQVLILNSSDSTLYMARPRVGIQWAAVSGAILAFVGCVAAALHTALSIAREREHGTWDVLLSTPTSGRDLFWAKIWGTLALLRYLAIVLGIVLGIAAVLTLPCSFMLLIPAGGWILLVMGSASLAVYFALKTSSTWQAVARTLATILAIIGLPIALGLTSAARQQVTISFSIVVFFVALVASLGILLHVREDFDRLAGRGRDFER
jgi:ABC-type transport system involved in multi-copper enzyme maturation permease subunit